MKINNSSIDGGRPFDWGRTSRDYARYRDIYPPEFYALLTDQGLCIKGQSVLDLGTGTGVLPRNMYPSGANWTGADISPEQIAQAKALADQADQHITFICSPAESLPFPPESFDTVTACQCFWYFDYPKTIPAIHDLLKPGGKLAVLQMEWLPFEDKLAGESEATVLKYNPAWTGAGFTRAPVWLPDIINDYFTLTHQEEKDLRVPFTRDTWHGRMRACRGTAASLSPEDLQKWEQDHKALLQNYPEHFTVLHSAAIAILTKK